MGVRGTFASGKDSLNWGCGTGGVIVRMALLGPVKMNCACGAMGAMARKNGLSAWTASARRPYAFSAVTSRMCCPSKLCGASVSRCQVLL